MDDEPEDPLENGKSFAKGDTEGNVSSKDLYLYI